MTRACNQVRTPSPCTHLVGSAHSPHSPHCAKERIGKRFWRNYIALLPRKSAMSKKKLHTYCILEGHLQFYLDKVMVRTNLGGFWETWGGLWGGLGRTLGRLLGDLGRTLGLKMGARSKKREGRSNKKDARREKEEPTRKKQEERRKKKQKIYIQTPDQPLLAAPYYIID